MLDKALQCCKDAGNSVLGLAGLVVSNFQQRNWRLSSISRVALLIFPGKT